MLQPSVHYGACSEAGHFADTLPCRYRTVRIRTAEVPVGTFHRLTWCISTGTRKHPPIDFKTSPEQQREVRPYQNK